MKPFRFIICLFSFSIMLLVACSEPSMDADAKKAAEYSHQSSQRAMDNDWSASEKYYRDAQEIIDPYRVTPQFKEFYDLYNAYLEENTYKERKSYLEDLNKE